ncbi:MAG: peptide deformylase [Gammaproteobacteria bacterium]|nr:peptide deformylase [Gammaproteobacteria bacterium]
MTISTILHYPDTDLLKSSMLVKSVNDDIQVLVDAMFETMYQAPGIGLAAPQIGVLLRVVVIDVSENKSAPLCLINPEITHLEGEIESEEGCLSVPGIYESVTRAERVSVMALDRTGQAIKLEADGLLAVCIQHEVDHLNGKLFVDYLSEMKRQRIRKKLLKQSRQTM